MIRGRAQQAHELILGGLLVFYQQVRLHESQADALRPYNVEKPLWVLLGTSVSRAKGDKSAAAKQERTDVAEVLAFLKHFLEVIGICFGGLRGDPAVARAATPVGANTTAPRQLYACCHPGPPGRGGVSAAPDTAVKGKVWRAGSAPGDSKHMGHRPRRPTALEPWSTD